MTHEAEDAWRVLYTAISKHQLALMQTPGADVTSIARESQHAALALQLVAEFLCRDGEVK